jgi:hypothetical protein
MDLDSFPGWSSKDSLFILSRSRYLRLDIFSGSSCSCGFLRRKCIRALERSAKTRWRYGLSKISFLFPWLCFRYDFGYRFFLLFWGRMTNHYWFLCNRIASAHSNTASCLYIKNSVFFLINTIFIFNDLNLRTLIIFNISNSLFDGALSNWDDRRDYLRVLIFRAILNRNTSFIFFVLIFWLILRNRFLN